jgi:hypothetical protein
MANKRPYTKRDAKYWASMSAKKTAVVMEAAEAEPLRTGLPLYVAKASDYVRNGASTSRSSRSDLSPRTATCDEHSNIDDYCLPFSYDKRGHADVKEPILLCQKAYFHIPIFRNTIDIMSELSSSDLVLSGGTKASRRFIKKWMENAKIEALKNQFFREYYRSGNIFIYRMFAEFSESEITAMKTLYAANDRILQGDSLFPKGQLPMRYVVLNPMDIVSYESLSSANLYKKVLSKFEAMRLSNPTTKEESRLLKSLKNENAQLDLGADEIYLDLSKERLVYVFYKKQDYEPFAVPFGFPILRDLNWKLELKKIDQSVSRSLENIILLITMGNEPDKGGINPKNLNAMKDLFANEALGRVLVADYTTKAQFVIPQIDNILNKGKYEIVNQDIKEGLQNIFFEDAKYANSEIKVKIFFEKLAEGKRMFINEFLQPEIERICRSIGFRDFPKIRFKSSNIFNESEIQKAAIRLMELGILTPKVGVESVNNKELPDFTEIGDGQAEYVEQRKEGQYTPLVGGATLFVPEVVETPDASGPSGKSNRTPVKKPAGIRGRPQNNAVAEDLVSVKAVSEVASMASRFEDSSIQRIKKIKNIESLSEEQTKTVQKICASIIESTDSEKWSEVFEECANGSGFDKLAVKPEIADICDRYEIENYLGALVYHSQRTKKSV